MIDAASAERLDESDTVAKRVIFHEIANAVMRLAQVFAERDVDGRDIVELGCKYSTRVRQS